MPNKPYPAERQSRNEKPALAARLVMQRLQTKQQIINELISGRMELLEAAARFQIVHGKSAETDVEFSASARESEDVCRNVIGWVCLALSQRPEEAERISARLEQELQRCLDRFGRVTLPSAN